jgi:hypothetical protein
VNGLTGFSKKIDRVQIIRLRKPWSPKCSGD